MEKHILENTIQQLKDFKEELNNHTVKINDNNWSLSNLPAFMWEHLGECIDDLEYSKKQLITVKDAINFAKWCQNTDNGTEHYNPFTKQTTPSIGYSSSDCIIDEIYTMEELFEK